MRILTIFFLTICSVAFGQKQGNIWYFGNHAGIDFSKGSPIALLNGQIQIYQGHNEGSSAISGSSGLILFYSDGMTIWNKTNQIMQNGTDLLGNFSSTQSSIIVPDPGSLRYFYLFTVSNGFCCNGDISDGLRYSIVDMCLDSLRGGVIPTKKNIKLVDTVAEKIAVTRHSNGSDYWILTHKFFSNEFWALHLTPNGITDTVITPIGTYHGGNIAGSQGQLKFSSNGKRIAIGASNGLDVLDIFDFNNSTGIISNWLPLHKPNNNHASIYGVEFSPDKSKLYASGVSSSGRIYPFLIQYDLNAGGGNLAAINASMNEIYHNTKGLISGRGLQIGPDNKIYWVSLSDQSTLASINNPNIFGSGCNYQDQTVSLAGRQGSYSLPSFISHFDYEVIVTANPRNARSFTLQPDTVVFLPGKQFTTSLEIPSGVNYWSVNLHYDPLIVKYNSISNSQAIPDDKNGELLVSGNGGSRSIPIIFDAFLPHTSDTIYPVKLSVNTSNSSECETWTATGNILMLADYCGKNIRAVSSTGKKYYLTVKERSIDFGVGLSGNVRLEVFDYVGNSVLVVSDGLLESGEYSAGLDLPLGVYYCRMTAGMYVSVEKVLIAR